MGLFSRWAAPDLLAYVVPSPYLDHGDAAGRRFARPRSGPTRPRRARAGRIPERIGTADLCASIPHRDAMLLFARGDGAYRDAMRALVREEEGDGRKPLTFELFTRTEAGVQPFVEP